MDIPEIFGLLSYHISGDDALFNLARERYSRAGVGLEIHPGSSGHLQELFAFLPAGKKASVHLPYGASLYNDNTDFIADIVRAGGDRIRTYVLHDANEYLSDHEHGIELIKKLSSMLEGTTKAKVCLEYSVGLPFELFLDIINQIKDLPNIGLCIDIGHIGIEAIKNDYKAKYHNKDICSIKPADYIAYDVYQGIAESVKEGRKVAFEYIETLCQSGAYTHFHIHDGHPLSTFSPYGVCDHLPFYWEIPTLIPQIGSISGMYGASGLEDVLRIAKDNLTSAQSSFTLEIHPQDGRSTVSPEFVEYFSLWNDMTNAEWMNYWIDIVIQNCLLVKNIWEKL